MSQPSISGHRPGLKGETVFLADLQALDMQGDPGGKIVQLGLQLAGQIFGFGFTGLKQIGWILGALAQASGLP
jgi:hypothetical protein